MLKPLFLGLAVTAFVASCSDDYTDWAQPQAHAQQEQKAITVQVDAVAPINANTTTGTALPSKVQVINATVSGAPRSAFSHQLTLTPTYTLSNDQKPVELTADSTGAVNLSELSAAVRNFYGRSVRPRTLRAAVVTQANVNDEVYSYRRNVDIVFTPAEADFSEYMGVFVNGQRISNLTSAELDGYYQGFAHLSSPFSLNYDYKKEIVAVNGSSFALLDGDFEAQGENIAPAANGFYLLRVDLKDATKTSLTPIAITKVGAIGTFNGWSDDQALTYDAAEHCFKGTLTFAADGEFKFRFNGTWDLNLGGHFPNELTFGGANLKVNAGTYDVRLYVEPTDGQGMRATLTAR